MAADPITTASLSQLDHPIRADTATTATYSQDTVARAPPAPPLPAHTTIIDPAIHERLLRDYKRLRSRIEVLEKENEGLRASLWEVSWRWGKAGGKGKARAREEEGEPVSATAAAAPAAEVPVPTTVAATPAVDLPPPSKPGTTTTAYSTSSSPSNRPSTPLRSPFAHADFMRLNEPALPASAAPLSTPLPSTPSSIASALFPTAPPRPSSPSSTSSRAANPAARDASLKRDLDISLPETRQKRLDERESWRWGRGYDLKGHRGAVYAVRFSEKECKGKGRLLASAGFDGIRVWGPKEAVEGDAEDGEAWDEGDVEEMAHLTPHSGPVSDVAFSPTTSHLLSGGFDSQIHVFPLASPTSSGSAPYAPIWSLATEGLVQTVAWLHPHSDAGSESGNVFVWGTSGKQLVVGDLRMEKPAVVVTHDAMVNSIQSFRRSPHLLVGDSNGQIRNFSLRTSTFLPPPEPTSLSANPSIASILAPAAPTPAKKETPISCLALTPEWGRKGEPRWMASVGFDNLVRVFDRGNDPLKSSPRLIQTLKGKNRMWPIRASWFQGQDYLDSSSTRRSAASRTRSRSPSFTSDPHSTSSFHDSDSDDPTTSPTRSRPLSSSLLLAAGSSDPVVLLYDLSKAAPVGGAGTTDAGVGVQRLEGHRGSVYAVDFLCAGDGGRGYKGEGVLASGGGDFVVKVWKPLFKDAA